MEEAKPENLCTSDPEALPCRSGSDDAVVCQRRDLKAAPPFYQRFLKAAPADLTPGEIAPLMAA